MPALACAQAVSGVAEWTVANGSSTSDGKPYSNQSFWQRYTVAFNSVLLDPRFVKYNADVTFRTNGLTFGAPEDSRSGRANDLGYNIGAELFPARPFPFVIQASRSTLLESGDYPSSNGIRGGIVTPPDEARPDFRTRNKALAMSWLLAAPNLPRVELSYRSSNSVIEGGPFRAEQHDLDFHTRISKDTARTRQALRYQRTETDNLVSQAFNRRLTDLNYDFSSTLSRRSRLMFRAGRRTTFSLFDVASQIVDPGTGAYLLPSRGTVDTLYATTGVSYEPHSRIGFDLTASMDRQDSRTVTTGAKLLATAARYEPVRGLSLFARGTYGDRDQKRGDVAVSAMTSNVQAGAMYRIGIRWVDANVGYTRGFGKNSTPGGGTGDVRSWNGQAGLSISVHGVTVGGGYERAESQDETFEFGNYDNRRQFLHAQTEIAGFTITGAWDSAVLVRGLEFPLDHVRQETFTATASSRVGRAGRLTATAGGFSSRGAFGHDEMLFWGGSYAAEVLPKLIFTVSARYDALRATGTNLDQTSISGFAKLDYRVRQFTFALEYHHNEQRLQYAYAPDAHRFTGHQFLLRISRKFGLRL
jgi:hypothetical protein